MQQIPPTVSIFLDGSSTHWWRSDNSLGWEQKPGGWLTLLRTKPSGIHVSQIWSERTFTGPSCPDKIHSFSSLCSKKRWIQSGFSWIFYNWLSHVFWARWASATLLCISHASNKIFTSPGAPSALGAAATSAVCVTRGAPGTAGWKQRWLGNGWEFPYISHVFKRLCFQ